jgi:hypothetical protein
MVGKPGAPALAEFFIAILSSTLRLHAIMANRAKGRRVGLVDRGK